MEIIGDYSTSVHRALEEIDSNYLSYSGVVICGTHTPKVEEVPTMLQIIQNCREQGVPFLGICYGFELLLVEFARSVLSFEGANSTELDSNTQHPVFTKLKELRVGVVDVEGRQESHWHNYAFNKSYQQYFELEDWRFVFADDTMEIARKGNSIGTQFHPEYGSSKEKPHPILVGFISLCRLQKDRNLPKNTE